jgi:hypothetical protein
MQAACLAVGLVSAWAPVAEAGTVGFETEVHYTSSFSLTVIHGLLLVSGTGSGGDGSGGVVFSNLTIPAGTGSGGWGSFHRYSDYGNSFAMIGLGSGSGGDGMHLIMSMGHLTHLDGTLFTQLFPGVSEAAIMDSLLTGSPLAENFLRDQYNNIRTPNGDSSVVTAFSGALDIGQISFSVIPGPSAAALGFVPLAALARRGRRR